MSFEKEIPQQFYQNVLIAAFLNLKQSRSVIFLTKNLKFYEFRDSLLIAEIELACFLEDLNSFELSILRNFQKTPEKSKQSNTSHSQSIKFSEGSLENFICMAKYVKYFGSSKKLYIILKIFDKILILERDLEYKMIKKLNDVENFEINDINSSYQAYVFVYFRNSNKEILFKDENCPEINDKLSFDKIKDLFVAVKTVRNEYEAQKRTRKKRFMALKNLSTYGTNLIRSLDVDEKQIVTRCGDIWMKTYNENVVIGIPIINSCTENLITLMDVCPILVGKRTDQLFFSFKIYEFKLKNINIWEKEIKQFILENIESDKTEFDENWYPLSNQCLKPGSTAVILLKSTLKNFSPDFIFDYYLFINFNLILNQKKFTQNIFIKLFEINLVNYLIQNDNILNQIEKEANFLTILETSKNFNFILQNKMEKENICLFEVIINFIEDKMKFKEICCKSINEKIDQMEIDDGYIEINKEGFIKTYANLSSSFWSDTVLKIQVDQLTAKNIYFQIFAKSDNHVLFFMQHLCKNFASLINISFYQSNQLIEYINFIENKLKNQISSLIESLKQYKNKTSIDKNELLNLQYQKYSKELEIDFSLLHCR